jgi:flagellar motor switch protein FliG
MSGERYAALTLFGLAMADRDWLLAKLPETQAHRIKQLLHELSEIGLPVDEELIKQGLNTQASATSPAAASPSMDDLRHATPQQMAYVLNHEPDQLIALVLKINPWPWGKEFLGQLDPLRAKQIRDLIRLLTLSPHLQESLLQKLAAQFKEAAQVVSRVNKKNKLQEFFSNIHFSKIQQSFRAIFSA